MRLFFKKSRERREFLFRWSGFLSLSTVLGALSLIVGLVFFHGHTAFLSTEIHVSLHFPELLTAQNLTKHLSHDKLSSHFMRSLRKDCAFLGNRLEALEALQMVSWGGHKDVREAAQKKIQEKGGVQHLNVWVLASDEADGFYKGKSTLQSYDEKRLSKVQTKTLHKLLHLGKIRLKFNGRFLTHNNSTLPELAGIWGAFCGSVWVLFVALLIAFPLGVGTALYLEELAPPTRWWTWIDLQLSNLASIPSVLFGLLTFIVFDYGLGIPRPSSLLGGLTIGVMMAPLLMVTTRVALQTVPRSIRFAACALGASHTQIIVHHVLPLAFPQMVASTLLTSVRALGETAPVLMVGMVAFVGNTPHSLTDAATTLPAQIFSWSKSPELGFLTKTSGGILALFFLLCVLNGLAFGLRRRFQREK